MTKSFLDCYDNLELTGTVMCDLCGDPRGEYHHDTLLEQLRNLKGKAQDWLKHMLNTRKPAKQNQAATEQHQMRIRQDILELPDAHAPGLVPVESKADSVKALVMGPASTPYEGG
ncbi:hypothetical protein HPB50_011966 [Hyalomma asiaticum]|uniref:Uncharacterized protein n=1 Tax=Hyalomma asiaticum TaxID=266040 RepID=A0ACB7SMM9_HYAAI|nr:hypothetical protein HPB50_011966 [Hyalomma asiaticum]